MTETAGLAESVYRGSVKYAFSDGSIRTVDVVLTNPNGQTSTLQNGFTYNGAPAPAISSISPASGPSTGGSLVTISGAGFTNGTTVTFKVAARTVFASGIKSKASAPVVVGAPAAPTA